MAFPDTLLGAASAWFSNVLVTAAAIQANVTDNLNTLATRVTGIGQGRLGGGSSASTVTLSTNSDFAGLGAVTFTLATQRRVKITVVAQFSPATAVAGRYRIQPGYNTGSSAVIGSVVMAGAPIAVPDGDAATTFRSGLNIGDALLAAGTWTVYAAVARVTGGAATDTATQFYTLVEDIGSI